MALGARPGQIQTQFLLLGARLLAGGVGLGLVGAWLAGRSMRSVLYGVSGFNLPTLVLTASALAVITIVACLLPSLRAARVSPVEALSDT
jgi:ABC-type antimicrobial peptide transport system permease subunit